MASSSDPRELADPQARVEAERRRLVEGRMSVQEAEAYLSALEKESVEMADREVEIRLEQARASSPAPQTADSEDVKLALNVADWLDGFDSEATRGGHADAIRRVVAAVASSPVPEEQMREALRKIAGLSSERQFIPTAFGGFLRDAATLEDAVSLAAAALGDPAAPVSVGDEEQGGQDGR